MSNRNYEHLAETILQERMQRQIIPLWRMAKENPILLQSLAGFLLKPEKIVVHMGKNHIAIESYGPERINHVPTGSAVLNVSVLDYSLSSDNFFDRVIGFEYPDAGLRMPLMGLAEEIVAPTIRGFEKLQELGWNLTGQESHMFLNTGSFTVPDKQFARISNSFFYDENDGRLVTRHIKMIDFIPIAYDDHSDPEYDTFTFIPEIFDYLLQADKQYVYPLPPAGDYRSNLLPKVNRFIEIWGGVSNETEITAFLESPKNQFILSMNFGAAAIKGQVKCIWQGDKKRPDLIPDFFVVKPNGFADILEFKLPNLKGGAVVGRRNRESLSAEISSYISQTRVYERYFEDPRNREWFKKQYGFDVYKPRRILVLGRRSDFVVDEWREVISDFPLVEVHTYDDIVDGVVAQFYHEIAT